nr:hypothetical protein GCM10020093_044700 [Planobispora longispora]
MLAWAERWRAVVRGAGRPSAPDPGELRAALGESALVEFVRHGDDLVAVAVTPGRITLRRLGSRAAVAEATVRLRYGLRRAHLRDGPASGTAGRPPRWNGWSSARSCACWAIARWWSCPPAPCTPCPGRRSRRTRTGR